MSSDKKKSITFYNSLRPLELNVSADTEAAGIYRVESTQP